ncbi:MMPL family transporter [Staphylococcus carnosus]|uniref:MMPL family protein n=1 Tax=Staphylococcus carnosus TaxID=1281 RepID=A0AAJ0JPJ2_STACA|nr:MMPL family transporter [Staphylococcus carnosus]KKB25375.1 MMPL family protein [Staphylococcus carnosus]POA03156.1 MMPL family transporter [Staphylococcus carnosus]QQS84535.1 MMPL family transporter [Staphylococcus carnosus]QRQ04475.1 MMPL family transporter [Staphylococcus carnosus]UTB83527.1 MMPL family protein [Staphylococcus carnosus]
MKTILKFRWIISIIVVIAIACSIIFAPNLAQLANDKGSIAPPKDTTSEQYDQKLKDVGAGSESISAVVQLDHKLDADSKKNLKSYINKIKDVKNVKNVTDPFQNKDVEDKLVSKNKKSILIPIETADSKDKTLDAVKDINKIDHHDFKGSYVTGNEVINNDINKSVNEGLKTTEIITVILILAILFLVFRSVVTPFVPLLLVGLSYLFSQGVLAFLVKYIDFPISVYIQPFLIALLFGIGTDYCILLLNRYKEELGKDQSNFNAVLNTFKHGGRTILICAITVLVGFAALFFVEFSLFRSAMGIAVGVLCLMIILFTLLPTLLLVLGNKVFWPSKKSAEHKDNALWGALGKFTNKRSFLALVIVLVVMVPIIVFAPNTITYDNTNEIGDEYDSIKAINIIKDDFSVGQAFPVNIAIKDDKKLTNAKGVNDLETLAQSIEKVKGVDSVNTITRPTGKPIKQLSATDQLNEIQSKLTDANNGLGQVNDGLGKMDSQVKPYTDPSRVQQTMQQASQSPQQAGQQATQQATEMSKGLEQSQQGINKVQNGQTQIQDRLKDMSKDKGMGKSGMYITDDMLKDKKMKQSVDQYSKGDGKVVLLNVELKDDPFSKASMNTVQRIHNTVDNQVKGTAFKNSDIEYGGMSSKNNDLQNIIDSDMTKAIALITVFLFVVLLIFERSIIMPLYMIASILITYYASIGIANLIFNDMLGMGGLLLVVPFFSFVVLMALGVDYAIFLVNRFSEEVDDGKSISEALLTAMRKMGTVIMTACIILIGTVAALYTSGAMTLMEIATVIILGLIIYNIFMLPFFIPALVKSFGAGNWWPFKTHVKNHKES